MKLTAQLNLQTIQMKSRVFPPQLYLSIRKYIAVDKTWMDEESCKKGIRKIHLLSTPRSNDYNNLLDTMQAYSKRSLLPPFSTTKIEKLTKLRPSEEASFDDRINQILIRNSQFYAYRGGCFARISKRLSSHARRGSPAKLLPARKRPRQMRFDGCPGLREPLRRISTGCLAARGGRGRARGGGKRRGNQSAGTLTSAETDRVVPSLLLLLLVAHNSSHASRFLARSRASHFSFHEGGEGEREEGKGSSRGFSRRVELSTSRVFNDIRRGEKTRCSTPPHRFVATHFCGGERARFLAPLTSERARKLFTRNRLEEAPILRFERGLDFFFY